MTDNIAKVAKFWADQLRTPPVHDLGDSNLNLMTNLFAVKDVVHPDKAQAFQDVLEQMMRDRPDEARTISVDYHACQILDDALTSVGIEKRMGLLPMKTITWLEDGTFKKGYGAPIEKL